MMLNCEELEFSLKGVSLAASQISMSRQGNKSCCNSSIQCSICPRLHMFDKNPGLNTSKYEYSYKFIAPPAGNSLFDTNLNMQCPICTNLHMFDKSHALKTSTCQFFSYRHSATCWQQEITCFTLT